MFVKDIFLSFTVSVVFLIRNLYLTESILCNHLNKFFLYHCSRDLTWRDIQHITVLSSKRNRLFDPYLKHHWKFNGAGLQFNHLFGYGVLDAGAMVDLAHKWKPLPERFHCTAGSVIKKM
jgi:hypothetical protein